MRIIVIRHGKPNLPPWPKIPARNLGEWVAAYTRADVQGSPPPDQALRAAKECAVTVTSDLARSTGSARALACSGATSQELFREANWPFTSIPLLRLQPYAWAAFFRILWFLGYSRNCGESIGASRKRAALAADRLESLARNHGCVLLVGHGIFNTLIVRVLRKRGWQGPKLPGYGYWSVTEYTK